uniref:Uncharacterized protein n=1 Tax=Nelumbo nucifera TaxID=4432 RepID=A0A822ZMH8_NELNU|nr:TPA_asm: hypothetical protein HUJ06_002799 [Nelumbo nucifera]
MGKMIVEVSTEGQYTTAHFPQLNVAGDSFGNKCIQRHNTDTHNPCFFSFFSLFQKQEKQPTRVLTLRLIVDYKIAIGDEEEMVSTQRIN